MQIEEFKKKKFNIIVQHKFLLLLLLLFNCILRRIYKRITKTGFNFNLYNKKKQNNISLQMVFYLVTITKAK